jgi:outer membrane receptor protein involved in Fe transport
MNDISTYRIMRKSAVSARLSAAAFAIMTAQGALAAEQPGTNSPTPGEAADTSEIIVTAQSRRSLLLETPMSIGVLDGAQLDQRTSRSVSDALNQIGGVFVSETQPGATSITIRGVVPGTGTSPAAFYLDETPFAFITQGLLPDAGAYDLARVEVLRGPQGTLYGANALSGVVRVLTNDPDYDQFDVKGRGRIAGVRGADTDFGGDIAVNAPLVDGKLAIRAVAGYSKLSGYLTSRINGAEDYNSSEIESYRVKLGWKPADQLKVVLGYTRSAVHNDGDQQGFADRTAPFSDRTPENRTYNVYSAIADLELPGVTVRSATNYLDYRVRSRIEIPFGADFLNYGNFYDLTSFSQELRLLSSDDGAWRWSAGAIFKDTRQQQTQDARPLLGSIYVVRDRSKSYAAFGEVTRVFGDGRFELTGGLRYFEDKLVTDQLSDFSGGAVVPRQTGKFDRVTGRLVASFKPGRDRLFYLSVGNGFRSGLNQTPAVVLRDPSFGPMRPDRLITYEGGLKGRLADGLITYDAAFYYTNWSNIQQDLITPANFVARVNAGKASGFGSDVTIALRPAKDLNLQAAASWNSLEFDQNIFQGPVLLFAEGQRVNSSPEWSLSLSGEYRTDLSATLQAFLSAGYVYRSKITLRELVDGPAGAPIVASSDSGKVGDVRASIGVEGNRWSLALFGENLLDRRAAILPGYSAAFGASLRPRPRRIGLQLTFDN